MDILDMDQRSPEWYEWRLSGLGASDICILTGSSKFNTRLGLWEIKCGFDEGKVFENPAIRHGIQSEDKVLMMIEHRLGLTLDSACIQDSENPIYKASLDGFDFDNEILFEIKCPYSLAKIEKARDGIYEDYYMDQIQWQMMICKPKQAFLAIYDYEREDVILIEIKPDEERMAKMRGLADEFWDLVTSGTPPESGKADFAIIEGPIAKKLRDECIHTAQVKKVACADYDAAKERVVEYGDGKNFTSYGMKVTHVNPTFRKSYDIDMMIIDGIDVEKYLKLSPVRPSVKITLPKEKNE